MNGLGLGLAYSRQLTSYLNGRLQAKSVGKAKGSVFSLVLPLQSDNGEKRLDSASDSFASEAKRKNFKTLLRAELKANKKAISASK